MVRVRREPSARQEELLERAYRYALAHGLADLSLRPLATAIGSSPRVLLFLFGSKAGLVRALLDRARTDELALLDRIRHDADDAGFAAVISATWQWLSVDAHRPLLTLWAEAYARSLVEPGGPWKGFARQTVDDWLDVLAAAQSLRRRNSSRGRRTNPRTIDSRAARCWTCSPPATSNASPPPSTISSDPSAATFRQQHVRARA